MQPPNLAFSTLVRGFLFWETKTAMSHYDLAKPGSEELVIACVQMEPHIGAKRANVARLIRHVETAAGNGASLVVLPELATTGYVFADRDEAFSLAEGLPDGETSQLFAETAQRLGVHIVTGIAERAGKRLYNSALFTGPSGHIGIYRKLHLWNNETVSSSRAIAACPCSALRSGALRLRSATTAGFRRPTGSRRCKARTSYACRPTGCRCPRSPTTARRWRRRSRWPPRTPTERIRN